MEHLDACICLDVTCDVQFRAKTVHCCRKQELQDLKRMQREEARQHQELSARTEMLREQQEKRFALEKQVQLDCGCS